MRRRQKREPRHQQGPARIPEEIPVLPTGNVVVFPHLTVPLTLTSDSQALAIDEAMDQARLVALFAQPNPSEAPSPENLYAGGTAASISRLTRGPHGSMQVALRGSARIRRLALTQTEPFLRARVEELEEVAAASQTPLQVASSSSLSSAPR